MRANDLITIDYLFIIIQPRPPCSSITNIAVQIILVFGFIFAIFRRFIFPYNICFLFYIFG